jgi:hypothetical protein
MENTRYYNHAREGANRSKLIVEVNDDPSEFFSSPEPLPNLNLEPNPFLLLRASGLPHADTVREELSRNNISVVGERSISEFEKLARYIYPVDPNRRNTYLWLLVARQVSGSAVNDALLFLLSKDYLQDYQSVVNIKKHIRDVIGITPITAYYRGEEIETNLHHIHAPDQVDLRKEFNILSHFINET